MDLYGTHIQDIHRIHMEHTHRRYIYIYPVYIMYSYMEEVKNQSTKGPFQAIKTQ